MNIITFKFDKKVLLLRMETLKLHPTSIFNFTDEIFPPYSEF